MLKIIHSGDMHLDTPFRRGGKERRETARGSFRALIEHIISSNADIALLPGDIYDTEFVTADTAALLYSAFERAHNTRFFISPGNHDPFTPSSLWAKADFPPNVHIFKSEVPQRIDFTAADGTAVSVIGYAFLAPACESAPAEQIASLAASGAPLSLLCAHCDMNAQSRYAPMSAAALASTGVRYAALGHIHNGTAILRAGDVHYAYSGALTPRDFGENGIKGALEIQISQSENGFNVAGRFLPLSSVRYEIIRIDAGGAESTADIIPALTKAARELELTPSVNVRITLEGAVSPSFSPDAAALGASLGLDSAPELDDRTSPTLDTAALEDDPSVRGAFYRALLPMLESEDIKTRRTAKAALKLGLSALAGADI